MNRSTRSKTLGLSLILLSCAQTPTQSNFSPSHQIREYKLDSQRRDLARIIDEKPVADVKEFLAPIYDKNVHFWVNYFSNKSKDRFERFLTNGYKYKRLIESVFESYNLPKELFYVGLIESGYYTKAKSRAAAVGAWQFIADTGKRYGLKIDSYTDERTSIIKSTQAAAKYFRDLYNIFGSWELALAAYNAGEYGIIRRIRVANTRDFYELSRMRKLPKETRHYVPKVLAAMIVAGHPQKYGINLPRSTSKVYDELKEVRFKGSYAIKDIAKAHNLSTSTIKLYNNDLKQNHTPPYRRSYYSLYLPAGAPSVSVSSIPKHKVSRRVARSRNYRVRAGDNLYSIARKHGVRVRDLRLANSIRGSRIMIGQRLSIPQARYKIHTVKKGEYLIKIAKAYGTTLRVLRKMNKRNLNRILPGDKIIISAN